MSYQIVSAGDLGSMGLQGLMSSMAGYTTIGADETPGLSPAVAQAVLAQRLAQNTVLVRNETPNKSSDTVLGFPATPITTLQMLGVQADVQEVFAPRRLLIPSDIAGLFDVYDVKVGNKSQFASSSNPVPGRAFVENGTGIGLRGDTAQISQKITIMAQNISGATATFRACVFGPGVDM